jgi:hypothetical protein
MNGLAGQATMPDAHRSVRQRISSYLRRRLREFRWRLEYRRLAPMENAFAGRRAFLVGSAPSLRMLDLWKLEGEFVCVVNLGLRMVGDLLPHADMHFINDVYCFEQYCEEIEADITKHGVHLRFVNIRLKKKWLRLRKRGVRPIFVLGERSLVRESETILHLKHGFTRGATVLVSAASVLKFFGFSEVYLIGCDLSYTADSKYAYPLRGPDMRHESRPEIIDRREDLIFANREFELMRKHFEASGQKLINAGRGGNLNSLDRVDYDSLFPADSAARPDD